MQERMYTTAEVNEIVDIAGRLEVYRSLSPQNAHRVSSRQKLLDQMRKYPDIFGDNISGLESGRFSAVNGGTILVAEDDENVAGFFKELLEKNGYEVHVVRNGRDAFRMMKGNEYDLLHLDLRMPDWDGVDCMGALSMTFPSQKIFVVSAFLTDDAEKEVRRYPTFMGAMPKPVDPEKYLQSVRLILSQKDQTRSTS